ncbi:MAG: winged helix-turn-helix transcriptional regulator, partial [Candidatus Symbiothrix sp.]|nr:winged helix-turn-helix transcriptional regulator [Candidatus Symbiothrix sp.]
MPPLTIETLLSNQYVSKPRNRQIASIIKDIGWIEKYGTDIRRIRRMFSEYGSKEPNFEILSGGFAVTVFAVDYSENITEETGNSQKTTEKILKLIMDNPQISQSEIAEINIYHIPTLLLPKPFS